VATLTRLVLRSDMQSVGVQTMSELLWVWDNVWGFHDGMGTEEHSGKTQ
jgi:hypothetical protein